MPLNVLELNSLAVLSAKNGLLYWQRIGRSDVKKIQAVKNVQSGKIEKVVPSSSANLIWKPPNYINRQTHLQETNNSLEYQTAIRFSPNGEILLILWYGTIFSLRIQEYSTLHNNFAVKPIAKIENCCGPLNINAGLNLGFFSVCGNKNGGSYILDFRKEFSFKSLDWNATKVQSKYTLGVKNSPRIQCCTWWEPSKDSEGNLLVGKLGV